MNNINWNAVYGFWLVSEHQSFAHAARALPFGSIQALHKRVRTLESKENLNLRLLRSRGVKGIELTEAGQRVFQLVSPVFRDFARLTTELRGENSGSLHIAATAFGSNNYVGDIVSAFSPRFPEVSIHLYLREPMDDVLEQVRSGRVDFGLCAPTATLADCEVKANVPLRFEMILPRGHRFRKSLPSWKELLQDPLILPERDMVLRKIFDELMEREKLTGHVRLKAELTTAELAVDAVRAGLGVALIAVGPRVVPYLRDVLRMDPPPGLPKVELTMLCKKDRYLSKYMHCFAEIASGIFQSSGQSAVPAQAGPHRGARPARTERGRKPGSLR